MGATVSTRAGTDRTTKKAVRSLKAESKDVETAISHVAFLSFGAAVSRGGSVGSRHNRMSTMMLNPRVIIMKDQRCEGHGPNWFHSLILINKSLREPPSSKALKCRNHHVFKPSLLSFAPVAQVCAVCQTCRPLNTAFGDVCECVQIHANAVAGRHCFGSKKDGGVESLGVWLGLCPITSSTR